MQRTASAWQGVSEVTFVALQGVTPLDVEHEVCDVKRYGMLATLHNIKPVNLGCWFSVFPDVWMPIVTFSETLARHGLVRKSGVDVRFW
jgi:hypothetical protein